MSSDDEEIEPVATRACGGASLRHSLIAAPVPRFFDQKMAAAYLSLSERTFEMHWRSDKLPQPHRLGRRLLWDRKLLDSWADAKSGIEPVPPALPFAESLLSPDERARRRSPNMARWKHTF